MSEKKEQLGQLKVTLKSGKVVCLNKLTIDDQRGAAKDIGGIIDPENQIAAGVEMQYAIAKRLIMSINGKALSGTDKEKLKEHLDFSEYNQVMSVIQEMMGKAEAPKVEFI